MQGRLLEEGMRGCQIDAGAPRHCKAGHVLSRLGSLVQNPITMSRVLIWTEVGGIRTMLAS
jgi:hypothetical protein